MDTALGPAEVSWLERFPHVWGEKSVLNIEGFCVSRNPHLGVQLYGVRKPRMPVYYYVSPRYILV